MEERVGAGMLFESRLLDRISRRDRASALQRPNVCQNAVPARACGEAELLWGVPQWQTCEKKHDFFMVFQWKHRHSHHRQHFQWPGNVIFDISDEKYFHRFPNSYFEAYFLLDFVENFNDFHRFYLHFRDVLAYTYQVCFQKA